MCKMIKSAKYEENKNENKKTFEAVLGRTTNINFCSVCVNPPKGIEARYIFHLLRTVFKLNFVFSDIKGKKIVCHAVEL